MFALNYKIIGLNIMRQRRLLKMTQVQLAEASGVSRSKISAIECGQGPYSIELVFLLAQALDVEYEQLIKRT